MSEYRLYGQRRPEWAKYPLGQRAAHSTIGGFGCVVCSITSMLSAFQSDPTPPMVNDRLLRMGQFAGANLDIDRTYYEGASGGKLIHVRESPYFSRPVPQNQLDEIFRHVRLGKPAMVLVDIGGQQPGVQTHFMLAVGVSPSGDDVVVNDPWFDVTQPLSTIRNGVYGSTLARALYRFNLYDIVQGW